MTKLGTKLLLLRKLVFLPQALERLTITVLVVVGRVCVRGSGCPQSLERWKMIRILSPNLAETGLGGKPGMSFYCPLLPTCKSQEIEEREK